MTGLREEYVQGVIEERLSSAAKARGMLSKDVLTAYDFRQLQSNLLGYVSALKSLIITIPRDVLGENFLLLYRRASGLEPLVMRATDTTQLLKYVDTADEIFVDLINLLYRSGVIGSNQAEGLPGGAH